MAVPEILRPPAGAWVVALGFVAGCYALLQGVTSLFFKVSPNIDAVPRDLLVNLLLGAVLYSLSRNLRLYLLAVGALLAALHLSNAGKIAVLGGPIMPDDFLAVRNLFLLLQGWQLAGAVAIIATPLVLLLLMVAWRPVRTWLILGTMTVLVSGFVMMPGVAYRAMDAGIGGTVWNQRGNYEGRGLLLHLVQEGARYLARASSPPSADEVASALTKLNRQAFLGPVADAVKVTARRPRNVHVIVLESFWDPMDLKAAGLSSDPVDPKFRELWRQAGHGRAMSPVFGGYTANAEFEVLCGFPVTEDAVFFEGWLRRDVPCLPRHLGDTGYRTIASHPNVAAFWNRVNAYERIGFDTYWSKKDFILDDMNREFLSDASLYRQVMDRIQPMLASDQPVFNYVLTYFGHLDYPLNASRPRQISVSDGNVLVDSFANTVYYKSRELMVFLKQLRIADPEGIVVLFGDHLPFLGPNFSGFTESGLLADNRGNFDHSMVRRLVSTPLVVIDGVRGPLPLGDVPMYRIPGLILGLLGDDRPSVMGLLDTPTDRVLRPLPGMHLIAQAGTQSLCRQDPRPIAACADSQEWLAAVITVTRDLFGGEQHLLRTSRRQKTAVASSWTQIDPDIAIAGY